MDPDANCIFCRIVSGSAPCHKVYEDENVLAFLDIAPSSPFHTLVIPKLHARYMHELGSDHASYMYQAIPKIAGAVFASARAEGYNLVQNNGRAAGQEVFHVHVHIIPRFQNDKLVKYKPTKSRIADDVGRGQVETIQRYLRQADLHLDTAEAENALGTQGLSDT